MKHNLTFPIFIVVLAILVCKVPVLTPALLVTAVNTPTVAAPLTIITSPQITDLRMLDANNGWAIGDTNVLRTLDGGTTWYNVTPAGISSLDVASSRFFLDSSNAWMTTTGATITTGMLYHTTDGGHIWSSTAIPFGGASLQFLDASDGWALAGLGAGMSHEAVAVFRTHDGGTTWSQIFIDDPTVSGSTDTLPLVGDKNGIVALDDNRGWVTGAQPSSDFIYVYISQDGGATWAQQTINMPTGYSGAMTNAFLPRFFNSTNGVLPVGLYFDTPGTVFYLSADGGLTWNPSTPVVLNGSYSIASHADFFVWNGGPALYFSHDSGATWSTVKPNINIKDTLLSFQFVNATTGWALSSDVNNHNSLYKTIDGGANWLSLIP